MITYDYAYAWTITYNYAYLQTFTFFTTPQLSLFTFATPQLIYLPTRSLAYSHSLRRSLLLTNRSLYLQTRSFTQRPQSLQLCI